MQFLIVDDHPVIHTALDTILRSLGAEVEVLHAATALEGIALAREHNQSLSLVLLDLSLPPLQGLGTLVLFRDQLPRMPVALYTALEDPAELATAIRRHGARGVIPKSFAPEAIKNALATILDGERFIPSLPGAKRLDSRRVAPTSSSTQPTRAAMTRRQRTVLQLLSIGLSNKRIAETLGVSETTVKDHVSDVLRVLGVRTRLEAVVVATRDGLTSPAERDDLRDPDDQTERA